MTAEIQNSGRLKGERVSQTCSKSRGRQTANGRQNWGRSGRGTSRRRAARPQVRPDAAPSSSSRPALQVSGPRTQAIASTPAVVAGGIQYRLELWSFCKNDRMLPLKGQAHIVRQTLLQVTSYFKCTSDCERFGGAMAKFAAAVGSMQFR